MEEKKNLALISGPIQGLTEPVWRYFHNEIYGGIDEYYTPFMRVERGEVRHRDVRDLKSEYNEKLNLVAQIIFRDMREFHMLCGVIADSGCRRIDINMGCPFPPQVHHGRGAGLITNSELLSQVANEMSGTYRDIKFSLKMRLGIAQPTEWLCALDAINAMPLEYVTLHPRTAKQQYQGELWLNEFSNFFGEVKHPIVYNGDIVSKEDISRIALRYPSVRGIMISRGLFIRPSLATEWRDSVDWSDDRHMESLLRLHDAVYNHYCDTLNGDTQILGKIKPFWEYIASSLDKRIMKDIKKASSLRKYDDAVMRLR